MFVKTVKFESPFDENQEVEETLCFNLSTTEIIAMLKDENSVIYKIASLQKEGAALDTYIAFREFALAAYGKRVGNRFVKNPTKRSALSTSASFDAFMEWVVASEKNAEHFIKMTIPKKAREAMDQALIKAGRA